MMKRNRNLWSLTFARTDILRRLREGGSAATISRMATSRHVADLQFIIWATVCGFIAFVAVAVVFAVWHTVSDSWKDIGEHPGFWVRARLVGDGVAGSVPVVGAAVALAGGILSWAYQSGSARLGIVDLFACEISTLCRVCTVVDLTRRYVRAFHADLGEDGPPDAALMARVRRGFSHFAASESYTPVFDQNARDLQSLDVKVVTHVTAFYTYMKAMRDALRGLAETEAPTGAGDRHDAWHEALRSVIYMQFLAFESARKAVRDLIEFEPNEIDNTINILVSELCAYQFLLNQFPPGAEGEDFRHARLRLRHDAYRMTAARAYWRAKEGADYWDRQLAACAPDAPGRPRMRDLAREWRKAAETANELASRYYRLFPGESLDRPADLPTPEASVMG